MKLFLLSAVFLIHSNATALTIISDIDDTLRISHVSKPVGLVGRVALNLAFETAPLVLQRFVAESGNVSYLSSGPSVLILNVARFIVQNRLPAPQKLMLRKLGNFDETYDYKVQALDALMNEHPEETYILMGDNVQKDPEVYAKIAQTHAAQVRGVYIRKIKEAPSLNGQYTYTVPYELAFRFYEKGWISKDSLHLIFNATLNVTREKRLIPLFQHCPKEYKLSHSSDIYVQSWNQEVETMIQAVCSKR